ncbi:MAG: sporulation protein YabP [Clostridia bacterium]|nr:sporulation protein YabP [Clostridia bacterium]
MGQQEIFSAERKHSLALKNRERVTLDGITSVISFDEGAVVLETALGPLTVEGEGLRVTKLLLEAGEVAVEGKVSALIYGEGSHGKGRFFRRLGG